MVPVHAEDEHMNDGYLSGKLLIASPAIGDPRFDRSVILMCEHSADHAMGLILNQPVEDLPASELFEQLDIEGDVPDHPVFIGGPVEQDRGFVLHSLDYNNPESTRQIPGGLGLTATRDVLEAIVSRRPPQQFILSLGYSGWSAGQLDQELAANAWLVADLHPSLIFDSDADTAWERALGLLGITPEHLSAASGHA